MEQLKQTRESWEKFKTCTPTECKHEQKEFHVPQSKILPTCNEQMHQMFLESNPTLKKFTECNKS